MDILESIIMYLKFLESEFSLFISIHCPKPPLNAIIPKIGKYGTHCHPFCMYIKSHSSLWSECLLMQSKVLNNSEKSVFYGECCFGVSEYVIPIYYEEKIIGFISVSGYIDKNIKWEKKIKRISTEYNLNYDEVCAMSKFLTTVPPSKNFIISILSHISNQLSMYASFLPKNNTDSNSTNYIYSNALAYIHEHYTEDITIDNIALYCNCSRSYLTKLFKTTGNFNIKSYITELRIQEAQKLLKHSDKSVKEIAFYVGYNDSNYFSNVFYKNTGIYPRKYRLSN